MDITFLDCSTVPTHSNALTLKLDAAPLEKVLRIVTRNVRLPSGRYLKNILNQESQNFSDQLIKELKSKLEYLHLHLSLASLFFEKEILILHIMG